MAQPIPLNLPARDPRAELNVRLQNAPLEHAEALLAAYEVLQGLHDRGVFELLRGALGSSDKVIEIVVDATKTPEAIRGMQLAWDGVKEGIFMPNPEQEAMGGAPSGFALGKLGILAGARWSVPGLRANVKTFDWDAVVMPKGSVRRAANSGTVGYSIASTTKTPADTWDLLKFVYSPQGWEVLAKSYSVVPPVKQLYNSPIWRDLPPPPKNNQAFIDASSDAVFVPYTFFADSAAIDKAVGNVFDKYIAGTPLDVAAKASNQDLQKQLDDYRQKKK